MNAEIRELVRGGILTTLQRSGKYHPTPKTLHLGLKQAGYAVTIEEVEEELVYLADKKFVETAVKAISPENRQYRITAAGRDFLAEEGLA